MAIISCQSIKHTNIYKNIRPGYTTIYLSGCVAKNHFFSVDLEVAEDIAFILIMPGPVTAPH